MKKITNLVFVFVTLLSTLMLTVAYAATPYIAYNLNKTTGTYTEITDGTVLGQKAYGLTLNNGVFKDDSIYTMPGWGSGKFSSTGIPLGFSLKIGDEIFKNALICANGALHFIKTSAEVSGYSTSPYSTNPSQKFLFRFSGKVKAAQANATDNKTTEISYKSLKIDEDSVFVVQYKNLLIETGVDKWDTASFQIRIFKSGLHEVVINKIGFTGTKADLKFSFGFQNFANDFIAFKGAASNANWASIEKLTGTNTTGEGIALNANAIPAANTLLKFQAPFPCATPQVSLNLSKLELTTTQFTARVAPTPGFDQVLVLFTEKQTLTAQPQDGKQYQNHELVGGANIVHQGAADVDFIRRNLKGDSAYYLHIYPKNYMCADGPLYGAPSVIKFRTSPLPPVMKLLSIEESSANIEIKPLNGTSVLMAATEKALSPEQYTALSSSLAAKGVCQVGDILLAENNLKVLHAGAGTTYQWTSMESNKKYFFYAWAYREEGGKYTYSTNASDSNRLSLMKNYTSPAILSFDNEDEVAMVTNGNVTPAGWTRLQTNGLYKTKFPVMDWSEEFQEMVPIRDEDGNIVYEEAEMDAGLSNFYYQKETVSEGGLLPSPTAKIQGGGENSVKVLKATMNSNLSFMNVVDSLDADIITPKILITSKVPQSFRFNYGANISGWMGSNPYAFTESDTLFIQLSENGKDWKTLKKISQKEADEEELYPGIPASSETKIEGYYNKEVQFRIVWHTYKNNSFLLGNFALERYAECKPVKDFMALSDSTTPNVLSWSWTNPIQEAENETETYNVRLLDLASQTWKEVGPANKNTFTARDLNPLTKYAIEVSAVCPSDTANPSLLSPLQYTLPNLAFTSDFQTPEWSSQKNMSAPVLPPHWSVKTVDFNEEGEASFADPLPGAWFINTFREPADLTNNAENKNLALSISMANVWGGWDFFSLPRTHLKPNHQALKLSYTLSINDPALGHTLASKEVADFDFGVFYSTNGGKTLKKADNLQLLEHRSATSTGFTGMDSVRYTVDIPSTESGNIAVMFGVKPLSEGSSTYPRIYIDDISLDYACPSVKNLAVSPEYTEAEFTWTEYEGSFALRHRKQGTETYSFDTLESGTSFILSNLEEKTNYEYGVQTLCQEKAGDWTKAFFTTLEMPYCDTVSRATPSIGKNSVIITWIGTAEKANIRYRSEDSTQWNTRYGQGKTITIEGLAAGTDYVYQLQQRCSEEDGDTSKWSKHFYFSTLPITCFVPTDLRCIATTYQKATIVSKSNASQRIYALKLDRDGEVWNEFLASRDTVAFTMLGANSTYLLKVRALCAFGDTSEFSEAIRFTMASVPTVTAPKNLKAESITKNSAVLSWDSADNHIMYMLLYKESSKSSFDTVNRPLYETSYRLSYLKENTRYDWKVMAIFDQWIQSPFSTTASFTTEGISIEDVTLSNLSFGVSAANGQLRIQNFAQTRIDKIEVYSVDGRKIENFEIRNNNDQNLSTRVRNTVGAIRIVCANKVLTYKIYFY